MGLLDNTTDQAYYQSGNLGSYQFTSLEDIINQFMIVYVGEDKVINKTNRIDVAFHAQRAMQELSFDTFKSCKSQEITLPASLTMKLPHDYVNYIKLTWSDGSGIEHVIYPTSKTSNPRNIKQETDGSYFFDTSFLPPFGDEKADLSLWQPIVNGAGTVVYNSSTLAMDFTGSGVDSSMVFKFDDINSNVDQSIPYRLNFTVTNYAAGSEFTPIIYLPDGHYVAFDPITGNGDYEYDIDWGSLSSSPSNWHANAISFQCSQAAGTFSTFSISNVTLVDPNNHSDYLFYETSSDTWDSYKSVSPNDTIDKYDDGTYDLVEGERYGLHPQHAQVNGSFFIDCNSGKIHFSSNLNGKTIILHYISDGLGTDSEMKVHKFAEEAMYKWIMYAILSTKPNIQEYVIRRYQKEKFAAVRQAKLRLSNIKLEELTQILRGKSKWIKH